MSSKTAKNTAGDRATLTSRWSWSITGRLTLLYTLSAFGMLVLSTAFLYWVLANNLERKDNQFLADEIHVLRVILRERSNAPEALEEEVKWEGTALKFTTYYARILDEERHTLIETPGMGIIPASLFPAPTGVTEASVKRVKWRFRDSRSYLLMSAWAAVGHSGGKQRLLQVALDMSYEDALLADYRLIPI